MNPWASIVRKLREQRLQPETLDNQGRIVIPVGHKAAETTMGPRGQRFLHDSVTGRTLSDLVRRHGDDDLAKGLGLIPELVISPRF